LIGIFYLVLRWKQAKKDKKRRKMAKKGTFGQKVDKSYRIGRISAPGGRVRPILTRNTIVGRGQSLINPKISMVGIKK
jgi:hypothetical protein